MYPAICERDKATNGVLGSKNQYKRIKRGIDVQFTCMPTIGQVESERSKDYPTVATCFRDILFWFTLYSAKVHEMDVI